MSSAVSVTDTARAFDAVANEYDGTLGNNALVQHMRQRVIARITQTFPLGARLLDLGCGTGIDAVDLASHGYEIVAIDSSPAMIERTRARAVSARLETRVSAIPCGIHELERLTPDQFDGLYSNLGALNCVPDLRAVSREMASLLKPRGRVIACVIGKYCPWEFTFYVLRLNFKRAFVRMTNKAVPVPLQGKTVWTRYYSPREFYRAFADEFELVSLRGLNVFLPPPYLIHVFERYRRFFARLEFLDNRLCGLPLARNFGDHFLIELQKR